MASTRPLTDDEAALAAAHLRLARWFARRPYHAALDPDEVESRCVWGLLKAAQSYRPRTADDTFAPWAVLWMRGELNGLRRNVRPKGYRARRGHLPGAPPAVGPLTPDLDAAVPDAGFADVDHRDEVSALMDAARLDADARDLLCRRYRLRQTGEEIAAARGVCEATVVNRINRALARLRAAAAG